MTDLEIHLNAPEDVSPEELASYLDKACGGDPALRERVEALFAAEAEASSNFLEESPVETDRTLTPYRCFISCIMLMSVIHNSLSR